MSELHFIVDKEEKLKQILTSSEYINVAYPLLKSYHDNHRVNFNNEIFDDVRGLLERRKYIHSIDGVHYMLTKEGINHLGELERKIR